MSVNLVTSALAGALTPLELTNSIRELIRSGRADSLVEYTQDARIEPICLIDNGLLGLDVMENALQCQLNTFSALYMMAVQIGNTEVNGVSINERLGRFNPNRDTINSAADQVASLVGAVATESFNDMLPRIRDLGKTVSQEADSDIQISQMLSKDVAKSIKENSNLSVGKVISFDLRIDNQTFTMPVIVRLQSIPVPGAILSNELCALAENLKPDVKERKLKLRAGALRFFKDFVACSDIIDNHMKTIVKDPTGLYLRSIEQARTNKLAGWISGRPSLATASSIYNISEETAVDIERRMGIELDNPVHRKRLFEKSSMMILTVFDREFERATVYYRGCKDFSRYSFKELNDKGNNDRTSDVLKMMNDFAKMKSPAF